MPITAAVLDVDGTIATCPYDFDAMRAAVARIAARRDIDTASLGVPGIIEQIALVADRLGEGGQAFRDEAQAAVRAIEVSAARGASLLPGAQEALADLRRSGLAVALITRNCREAAEIVLRDCDGCCAVLLTRDDVPLAKPDPDHVLRAIAALGRVADHTVVVGDHDYDMQAGRAAGVRLSVAVRTGNRPDEALRAAGADHIIDTLADLPDWLRAQGEMPT